MIPFGDVLIALAWLGALYVASYWGVLALIRPGDLSLLRYGLGRVIGLVGLGAITWVLSLIRIVPFTALWIWLIILVLYVLTFIFRRKTLKQCFKAHWRSYLFIEAIFIALFIVGVALRSSIPKIEGIEKMMDSAILSNLLRHTAGVPVDTWYAPDSLNYYYFGHWLVATIAKMSRTGLAYAFNLGFATVLATAGTSIYILGWQIAKRKLAGFLALFLTFFASNLHPFLMTLTAQNHYFFFNSGRFIEQVINEYPLYSLILGDLHAHMMALVLSFGFYLTVALLYLEKPFKNSRITLAAIAGGLVGLLSATNSFDVISCSIVFGLLMVFMRWRHKVDNYQLLTLIMAYVLAFILLAIVFLTHFNPAIGGVGVALFKTPIKHILWQFGLPLILGLVAAAILWRKRWLKRHKQTDLIWILAIGGIALILLPEFIYLKDIYYYQNPPFARANTVFKVWYSAWPLIAVSAASLLVLLDTNLKTKLRRFGLRVIIIAACVALSFGLVIGIKTLNDYRANTLNGLAYLKTQDPAKLETVDWASKNIIGQSIVLQAVGQSYTDQSWLASYSGLPTIIGWQSHEWGWRYSSEAWSLISYRSNEVKAIYESTDSQELCAKAEAVKVAYILVGPDELNAYKINRDIFNGAFGQPVFDNARYAIYSVSK